jgi:hypothetical protein
MSPGEAAGTFTVPSFWARGSSGPMLRSGESPPSPSIQIRAEAGPSSLKPKISLLLQRPSMMTAAPCEPAGMGLPGEATPLMIVASIPAPP